MKRGKERKSSAVPMTENKEIIGEVTFHYDAPRPGLEVALAEYVALFDVPGPADIRTCLVALLQHNSAQALGQALGMTSPQLFAWINQRCYRAEHAEFGDMILSWVLDRVKTLHLTLDPVRRDHQAQKANLTARIRRRAAYSNVIELKAEPSARLADVIDQLDQSGQLASLGFDHSFDIAELRFRGRAPAWSITLGELYRSAKPSDVIKLVPWLPSAV